MRPDCEQNIQHLIARNNEYQAIISHFKEKGAINFYPTDSFAITIMICEWDRPDMRANEICDMVDKLISDFSLSSTSEYFNFRRRCNCIDIWHKQKFNDEDDF